MARESKQPHFLAGTDDLIVADDTWLNLGQLRALVAEADERGWPDGSLVSHSTGSQHVTRHDVRIAHKIVIEGRTPNAAG